MGCAPPVDFDGGRFQPQIQGVPRFFYLSLPAIPTAGPADFFAEQPQDQRSCERPYPDALNQDIFLIGNYAPLRRAS
jgi:hypothetical protein